MHVPRRTALILGVGAVVTTSATLAALLDEKTVRDRAEDALLSSPLPDRGPVSLPDWTAARAALRIPADARIVEWTDPVKTLEEMFMGMAPGELLGIPRDTTRYFDTADGFRTAGAASVDGANGTQIPLVSTYQGQPARTWFAMARARRGIVGLGPTSVLAPKPSAFKQERQIPDRDDTTGDPGRFWTRLTGDRGQELVGAQEKVVETEHADGYYGNFTMRGADFGGVAYSAIAMKGGTAERLRLDGAWRGFAGVPNGETAAIAVFGGQYLISRCSTSPLDAEGNRVGSSPIMINHSPGGRWEHGEASQALAGMPTIWASSGKHELVDVVSRWGGPGLNLEETADGFELVWDGGICWPNRDGKGGHPSPDGIYSSAMHIHLHALGRATITLIDVDLDTNVDPGKLCVATYGGTDTTKVTVTATADGQAIPVHVY